MVFFIGFATDWAATSNILQHAWIHWATRGLYTGYRRVNLNTQGSFTTQRKIVNWLTDVLI